MTHAPLARGMENTKVATATRLIQFNARCISLTILKIVGFCGGRTLSGESAADASGPGRGPYETRRENPPNSDGTCGVIFGIGKSESEVFHCESSVPELFGSDNGGASNHAEVHTKRTQSPPDCLL